MGNLSQMPSCLDTSCSPFHASVLQGDKRILFDAERCRCFV
jgi:hypothetical protein